MSWIMIIDHIIEEETDFKRSESKEKLKKEETK